jgi:hypothetical protein
MAVSARARRRPPARRRRPKRPGVGSVILFALLALLAFVGAAFAAGYLIGKLLI